MKKVKELILKLKLYGFESKLDSIIDDVKNNNISIQEALLQLLESEHEDKQNRALSSRIKQAKMPWNWHLETFPFDRQPGINKAQILTISKLDFIKKNENITLIGKPGVGKTGIAIGLLNKALINGYRCKFYNAQNLLDEVYTSLADRSTSRLLTSIAKYDLLVIDELGYLTLTEEQINIFFKLIDMRYSQNTTIITTNLSYNKWYEVFKNKDLVDAMLDRFKHHCTTIEISGPSLRVSEPSKV